MKRKMYLAAVAFLLCTICSKEMYGQSEQEKVIAAIRHLDSLFWNAYNSCDTGKFKDFFTDDVEFYHDKGGETFGSDSLVATFKKNICGADYKIRREAVEGSVKVFPLQKGNEIYGAVISGEHSFYMTEKGKAEYQSGQALFTHLWLLKDGVWKMARVLSYNHHEPDYINKRKEITLDKNKLEQLTGTYKAPQSGEVKIQREDEHLLMLIGEQRYVIYPESETVFFSKERDLTFEFVKDNYKVSKMIVREKGNIVEETVKVK